MLVQYCLDLASLSQSLEDSIPGSGLESYFQVLIYLPGQVNKACSLLLDIILGIIVSC